MDFCRNRYVRLIMLLRPTSPAVSLPPPPPPLLPENSLVTAVHINELSQVQQLQSAVQRYCSQSESAAVVVLLDKPNFQLEDLMAAANGKVDENKSWAQGLLVGFE